MTETYKKLRLGGPASYGEFAIAKRIGKLYEYMDISGKKILDIGCGNGAYTIELAKKATCVIGMDVEPNRLIDYHERLKPLRAQKEILNNYVIHASGEHLPFKDGYFDIVTMIEVFEHVNDEGNVLKECNRVLKDNGTLVFYVPNKLYPFETHGFCGLRNSHRVPFMSWLPTVIHKRIAHARIYTVAAMRRILEANGFILRTHDYIYPPVDRIPLPSAVRGYCRRIFGSLEKSFLKIFGVSILIIAGKNQREMR